MAVKVIFRGLILFRTEERNGKSVVVEALMPDTGRPPKETATGRHHCDHSVARRHHAGLLTPGGQNIDITHAEVDFRPNAGNAFVDATVLSGFPRIDKPKNKAGEPLRFDSTAPFAARVDMRFANAPASASGGDIEPDFHFGSLTRLPLQLEVGFSGPVDVMVRTLTGPPLAIKVNSGTLYVYHADMVDPTEVDLLRKAIPPRPLLPDIDFKWYYSATNPSAGTLVVWAGGDLTAPVYTPPAPTTSVRAAPFPSVSTCFPGWI